MSKINKAFQVFGLVMLSLVSLTGQVSAIGDPPWTAEKCASELKQSLDFVTKERERQLTATPPFLNDKNKEAIRKAVTLAATAATAKGVNGRDLLEIVKRKKIAEARKALLSAERDLEKASIKSKFVEFLKTPLPEKLAASKKAPSPTKILELFREKTEAGKSFKTLGFVNDAEFVKELKGIAALNPNDTNGFLKATSGMSDLTKKAQLARDSLKKVVIGTRSRAALSALFAVGTGYAAYQLIMGGGQTDAPPTLTKDIVSRQQSEHAKIQQCGAVTLAFNLSRGDKGAIIDAILAANRSESMTPLPDFTAYNEDTYMQEFDKYLTKDTVVRELCLVKQYQTNRFTTLIREAITEEVEYEKALNESLASMSSKDAVKVRKEVEALIASSKKPTGTPPNEKKKPAGPGGLKS